MVNGAFLEGQAKMLMDTAEVNNPKNLEMHKSGLNLWKTLEIQLRSGISAQCDKHP